MDLKNMLLPEKTVSFDFPGCEGLTFDLTFLSKEANQTIFKKCQVQKFDSKTRQPRTEFDDDLFLKLYVKAIIRGWKGFKLKYLEELALVKIDESQAEEELNFSDENALELMKNSTIFDDWVSGVVSDLENFTKSKSKTKKNESENTSKTAEVV
jgi:hypothetical protein